MIYLRSEVVIVQFVIFIMYRSGPGTQAWMGTMGISRTQSFGLSMKVWGLALTPE